MNGRHIAELLIEANKKISALISLAQSENPNPSDHKRMVNDINTVIRELDHIVESLDKTK